MIYLWRYEDRGSLYFVKILIKIMEKQLKKSPLFKRAQNENKG